MTTNVKYNEMGNKEYIRVTFLEDSRSIHTETVPEEDSFGRLGSVYMSGMGLWAIRETREEAVRALGEYYQSAIDRKTKEIKELKENIDIISNL